MLKRVHFESSFSAPRSGQAVMEFEDILDRIGGWGLFQKRLWFFVTILMETVISMNFLLLMYAMMGPETSHVDWECLDTKGNDTTPVTEAPVQSNSTNSTSAPINPFHLSEVWIRCQQVESCKKIKYHSFTLATEYGFVCSQRGLLTRLADLQLVGVLFGALIWAQITQIFGRKRVLLAIYLTNLASGFLIAFSVSPTMTAMCMFGIGTAAGGYWCVSAVLVQECVGKRNRIFVAVLNGWPVAVMVFCFLCFLLEHYRRIAIAVNCAGIASTVCFLWIEESPRWLLSKGLPVEAAATIRKMGHVNGKPMADADEVVKASFVMPNQPCCTGYHSLFNTKTSLRHILALLVSWFIMAYASHTMSKMGRFLRFHKYFSEFTVAVLNGSVIWSLLFFRRFFGRRSLHQITLATCGVCALIIGILQSTASGKASSSAVTAFAAVGSAMMGPVWPIAYLYSVELYPTHLRSLSNGICSVAARIGAICVGRTFASPVFKSSRSFPSYLVFALILLNLIIAYFFLPETKGKPLPELFGISQQPDVRIFREKPPQQDSSASNHTLLARNGHVGSDELSRYDVMDMPIDSVTDLPQEYIVIGRHQE